MNDLIREAIIFATLAHGDQRRKYVNLPYIYHPIAVSEIVFEVNPVQEVVAAAVLHDTIEDTETSYDDIYRNFGETVADLVMEVTDVSKPSDGNREIRKAIDREHLRKASADAQTIKLADLIDNTKSIVGHDHGFARVYLAEKKRLLQVLTKGNKLLWERALGQVIEGESRLGMIAA